MAPVPPPPDSPQVPPLHLRVLDLNHRGTQRFWTHTSSPGEALSDAASRVLSRLYPTSVYFKTADTDSNPPTEAQHGASDPRPRRPGPPAVRSVTLHLHAFEGIAYTCGSDIDNLHKELHLSTDYLASIGGDDDRVRHEIRGVLVHELVHAFQWDGSKHGGGVPGGVIEGIADWVRLKEGLGPPHWSRGGDRWDAGYQTTAYFLEWLEKHFQRPDFVPALNMTLRDSSWQDGRHLRDLCHGENVEDLWKRYLEDLKGDGDGHSPPRKPIPTHRA